MHSFSYKIKEEIIDGINTRDKADACMLGLLTFANSLDYKKITLLTENEPVKDFLVHNANRICGEGAANVETSIKRDGMTLYTIDIEDEQNRLALLEYLQIDLS